MTVKVVAHAYRDQRRSHPYLAQPELKDYCDKKGIVLTAYAPTGELIPRARFEQCIADIEFAGRIQDGAQ